MTNEKREGLKKPSDLVTIDLRELETLIRHVLQDVPAHLVPSETIKRLNGGRVPTAARCTQEELAASRVIVANALGRPVSARDQELSDRHHAKRLAGLRETSARRRAARNAAEARDADAASDTARTSTAEPTPAPAQRKKKR